MADAPLFHVFDDFLPPDLFAEACKLGQARGWAFGHGSNAGDGGRFWLLPLDGITLFDTVWDRVRARCEELAGAPLRVLRQYANGHTYGLGGQPHTDDTRPRTYTLLLYPMAEWPPHWEGETVFLDDRGDVTQCVSPRPNRAVLFDARVPHAGRAPSRACPALRVTVAFKLIAAEPPAAAAEPTGAVREYAVRVPTERVDHLTDESLGDLGRSVRLPGYRPGEVPLDELRRRYGDDARRRAVERLAAEAAAGVPPGNLVVSVHVTPAADHVAFRVEAVHLPVLPDPDVAAITVERLTADDAALAAAGVSRQALADHAAQQLLDALDAAYTFPVPATLVDREAATLWDAAQAAGEATEADRDEARRLAERRVRLGVVVAELARRAGVTGPDVEAELVARLLAGVRVVERPATSDELALLA